MTQPEIPIEKLIENYLRCKDVKIISEDDNYIYYNALTCLNPDNPVYFRVNLTLSQTSKNALINVAQNSHNKV